MNYQWLLSQLSILQEPHRQSFTAVNSRASDILRPTGALAKLDEIAAWVGSWHKSFLPVINNPATVIFAGDHGIALSGVSNYPVDVTAAMVAASAGPALSRHQPARRILPPRSVRRY